MKLQPTFAIGGMSWNTKSENVCWSNLKQFECRVGQDRSLSSDIAGAGCALVTNTCYTWICVTHDSLSSRIIGQLPGTRPTRLNGNINFSRAALIFILALVLHTVLFLDALLADVLCSQSPSHYSNILQVVLYFISRALFRSHSFL